MAASRRIFHLQRHLLGYYTSPVLPNYAAGWRGVSTAAQEVLNTRKDVNILDSHISYLDTGVGDNVVIFLHGNPTSSFLWRNIIPHVKPIARCYAPDLIGMGKSGKEPNNSYRFVDHYKYLSAWFDAMNFPKKVSIVCHDWGSALGFHWGNEHRDRVESIIHMESVPCPVKSWDSFPDVARNIFKAIRSPAGEEIILKKNFFVEQLLPHAIQRKLTDEEMAVYREPFLEEGESRRPTLTFPREIPIISDGPEDVVKFATNYAEWLLNSKDVPKLYIESTPGFFAPALRGFITKFPNQKVVQAKGLHFLQEDSPDDIGKAIYEFLKDLYNQ